MLAIFCPMHDLDPMAYGNDALGCRTYCKFPFASRFHRNGRNFNGSGKFCSSLPDVYIDASAGVYEKN